ncbi:probable phytol kinase 3, chloroplastic [Gastrolobium bilobum]|uniref:probable phytol kinase 3, chloroplastic n=1 Tax=Gastrolobium bilobum TaxID=150636 RepID=UPI002AB1BA44|nr:probable phytol kinase 3, chloroplastic [Gastrolobium bilobum]
MFRNIVFQRFDPVAYVSVPLLLTPIRPISHSSAPFLSKLKPTFPLISSSSSSPFCYSFFSATTPPQRPPSRRNLTSFSPPSTMLHHDPLVSDICATALSGVVALSILRLWQETAKRGLFDQKLNRKLVHISIGLVFMLCWPLFSTDNWASILAALIPGVNIIRMLITGLGIYKDEATVKAMSRFGDYRELLKGPLYYASTITLACIIYWRTSPISIAAICNLCAGDGMADVIGRRFGGKKIPYNKNKSYAGSIAMASAGFLASIGYMWYFSSFGFIEGSWEMILGFLIVSIVTAFVESLPISTELDDNLTVPLTSILVGTIVF